MTSPIDPSLNNSTLNPNRATGALAEKASSLLKSGIPHVLSAANGSFNTAHGIGNRNGAGGKESKIQIVGRTEEEFTRIKILLRAIESRRDEVTRTTPHKVGGGSKKRVLPVEIGGEVEGAMLKMRGMERWRGELEGRRERRNEGETQGEEKKLVSVRYRF